MKVLHHKIITLRPDINVRAENLGENGNLKKEMDSVKHQNEVLKDEILLIHNENEKVEEELKSLKIKNEELMNISRGHAKEQQRIKNENAEVKKENMELKKYTSQILEELILNTDHLETLLKNE